MSSEVLVTLNKLQEAVDTALHNLEEGDFASRTWKKDPSLWKQATSSRPQTEANLGWLEIVRTMTSRVGDLLDLANTISAEGITHLVVLGMGGSSLGPEVLRRTFGPVAGSPELLVIDTIEPGFILQAESLIDLARTLFIVSSKSGRTVESNALLAYFFEKLKQLKGLQAGQHFLAITDPGTPLEKQARENGFREVFLNPPDIGGRFSVLSYFGLVPAVLAGYNIRQLLARAVAMAEECHKPGMDNPGLHLGAILGVAAAEGCDKVTLVLPDVISGFGIWAGQLIAESTGKNGGVVPVVVVGEPLADPAKYGNDRIFVCLNVEGYRDSETEISLKKLEEAGHPVLRLSLKDQFDIAAEFFRWEFAVTVVGALLGINPFEPPEVTESKEITAQLLVNYQLNHQLPAWPSFKLAAVGSQEVHKPAQMFNKFFNQIMPGDYLVLMAYTMPDEVKSAQLQELRLLVRDRYKIATTVGYGPSLLHSTGQLHKGGPNNAVFIQLVSPDRQDLPIPAKPYGFSVLKQAQALGDFEALQKYGRRVISLQTDLTVALADLKEGLPKAI